MTDKPGPELDRQIACLLFGQKEDPHRNGWVQVGNLSSYPRQYSTTWEGMQLVVEEMQRRGWGFTLQRWGKDETGDSTYEATFGFLGDKPGAMADTAPHAVALAAIEALKSRGDDAKC